MSLPIKEVIESGRAASAARNVAFGALGLVYCSVAIVNMLRAGDSLFAGAVALFALLLCRRIVVSLRAVLAFWRQSREAGQAASPASERGRPN